MPESPGSSPRPDVTSGLGEEPEDLVERGLQRVNVGLAAFLETRVLSTVQAPEVLSRLDGAASLQHALDDVQLVSQAVAQNLVVKRELSEMLDSLAPPETILATSTLGLRGHSRADEASGA